MLSTKQLFKTPSHPQTNSRADCFNKAIASRLKRYIADHQGDCDAHVSTFTDAHNRKVYNSMRSTPFNLMFLRVSQSAVIETRSSAPATDGFQASTAAQSKRATFRSSEHALSLAKARLSAAKRLYKKDFDLKNKELAQFKERDSVFLDKPQETSEKPPDVTRKLAPKTLKPYKVLSTYKYKIAIEVNGIRNVVSEPGSQKSRPAHLKDIQRKLSRYLRQVPLSTPPLRQLLATLRILAVTSLGQPVQ